MRINQLPLAGFSLRRTFLLYIVLAYAVVAAGTWFAFSWSAGRISARYASRYSVSQGELERNRVLSLVDRELALSRKLADDPSIRAWMLAESDPALRKAAMAQLESYRHFLHDGTWFLAIESGGSYWARNPALPAPVRTTLSPGNAADRWFYAALRDGRDYSLNVDHNAMLGENRLWINVLVRDDGGRPIGLAGCGMDLTAFLDALVAHEEGGVTTVVIDRTGALMAYRDRDLIAHNAEVKRDAEKIDIYSFLPAAPDRERLRSSLSTAAVGRKPGVFELTVGTTRELCAVSSLPELGWYGLVFVDAGRIIGLADFIPMALVTLASLLVILASVIAGLSLLIVAPIRSLTVAAGRVAGGAYDVVLPEIPRNEIGHLASSFNAMTLKVKEYTSGLEGQVAARTRELLDANERLQASQTRIMDSIHYARLIQDSILPSRADLDASLAGHFEIVRPRDPVGGDFFFFRAMADGFCLAVADCTGHGVPGAFMTMMAKAHLDRIVEAEGAATPSDMIRELDRLVRESLKGEAAVAHLENGLDIALCRYRASSSSLEFSGGGLPLFLWKDGALTEVPGDRTHLGFSGTRRGRTWTDRIVDVSGGARVYLVSDGVFDLPGGKNGLPFGRARLRSLIEKIAPLSFGQTEAAVTAALDDYRGSCSQRDDLTFIGFGIRGREA